MPDDDPKLVLDHADPVGLRLGVYEARAGVPATRAECLPGGGNAARPCPFVRCRYSTYLVDKDHVPGRYRESISSTANGGWIDPSRPSCTLDVVDSNEAGCSAEEIGRVLGITTRRVEQLTRLALIKVRAARLDVELEDPVHDYAMAGDRPIGYGRSR